MQSRSASKLAAGLVQKTLFPWNSWPILSNLVVSVSDLHRNVVCKSTSNRIISKELWEMCFDVYGFPERAFLSLWCHGNSR